MIKKKYSGELFECLNWILKKNNNLQSFENLPSVFLLNRWLSMADKNLISIINETFNKWTLRTDLFKEQELVVKFYRKILPKVFGKINYLKKESGKITKELTDENENCAYNLEISERELALYKDTLALLNQTPK